MTGWNERAATISSRAGQLTHAGIRLRAAASPIGSDSAMPERRCEHRDLQAFGQALDQQLPAAEVRREHPLEKMRWRCASPAATRSHDTSICAAA